MSNKEFKENIADLLDVSLNVIENELFMGCSLLAESIGEGDSQEGEFTVTQLEADFVDEEGELEHFRKLVADGRNVDMTAHSFSDSESFIIERKGVKLRCSQSFNRHVDEDFERDPKTREIIKRDWTFTGMMELTTFSVNVID